MKVDLRGRYNALNITLNTEHIENLNNALFFRVFDNFLSLPRALVDLFHFLILLRLKLYFQFLLLFLLSLVLIVEVVAYISSPLGLSFGRAASLGSEQRLSGLGINTLFGCAHLGVLVGPLPTK